MHMQVHNGYMWSGEAPQAPTKYGEKDLWQNIVVQLLSFFFNNSGIQASWLLELVHN